MVHSGEITMDIRRLGLLCQHLLHGVPTTEPDRTLIDRVSSAYNFG
jgi:hypothetical protein